MYYGTLRCAWNCPRKSLQHPLSSFWYVVGCDDSVRWKGEFEPDTYSDMLAVDLGTSVTINNDYFD
jgi:hypothetical protein